MQKDLYTLSFFDISIFDIKMVYYNMWDMMYGFGLFGMILFWAAVIWLIMWTVQQFTKNKESALDIIEKRYANGELTKKQYQEMRKTLRK